VRFAVKFLGCKVSQADAMLARRQLLEAGHEEASEAEAELHVINTCCITGEAESKSRQSVRRSLKTARKVFVGGCAVNLHPTGFAEIDPAVKVFTGTADEAASAMASAEKQPLRATGACIDLEHDALLRRSVRQPQRVVGKPYARLCQGARRLRLSLCLLHHPHRARRCSFARRLGGIEGGRSASRARSA
jgi:tRNA A37 methylthiotransferase MiaB